MPEVIPELVYVIGLFFAIVGYVTARGLLATWTHSLGYVFRWLATHLRFHVSVPFKTFVLDIGGPFRAVDSWAVTALQNWCDGAEIQMGYCLHGMAKVALYTAQAIDFLTRETVHAFERLNHIRLRQILKALSVPVLFPLLLAKLLKALLPHIHSIVYKPVQIIYRTIPHTAARVAHKVASVAVPYAHAIPRIERQIHGLTRRNLRLSKRLHRVESLFGVAAMAAVMANVLGLPNWRCLTRGNIGRAARHFCGLDKWLVDLLLIGSIEAFAVTDLCAFSNLLMKQAELIRPVLMELVDVEDALINCGGTVKPMLFDLPAATLPPLQGVSPLAA